jgi:hypothetical protein
MKAKLAHSVEISHLIDRISELVGSNVDPLKQTTDLLSISYELLKMEQDDSAEHVLELLDRVRKRLAEVDESLLEASSLLKGYILNVLSAPAQQTAVPIPEPQMSSQPAPEPSLPPELPEVPEQALEELPSKSRSYEYKPKYRDPNRNTHYDPEYE